MKEVDCHLKKTNTHIENQTIKIRHSPVSKKYLFSRKKIGKNATLPSISSYNHMI